MEQKYTDGEKQELKAYLKSSHAEQMPAWLESYSQFDVKTLKDFFRSRLVYYPGARVDLDPLEVFGRSGSAHCFVLVDYLMTEAELQEELTQRGFEGYHICDSVSVTEREMFAVVRPGRFHLNEAEMREVAQRSRMFNPVPPYARFVVFERDEGASDEVGPARLAVLFIGAEGIATYDAVFASRQAPNFFAFLLQDHGFGCNWDHFGHGGWCERIAQRSGVFPAFILNGSGEPDIWDGYERVTEVLEESTSPRGRVLYRRKA